MKQDLSTHYLTFMQLCLIMERREIILICAALILISMFLNYNIVHLEVKEWPSPKLAVGRHVERNLDICPPWQPNMKPKPSQEHLPKHGASAPDHDLKSLSGVTSASNSKIEIINPKSSYRLCDRIAIRIVAKNDDNITKLYGGDYFRSKIFSTDPSYSASGPDYYVDYYNGTYLLLYTLRWTGIVDIQVTLVHPSEAIAILKKATTGRKTWELIIYYGIFESMQDGSKYSENVICNIADTQSPSCNFSAVNTHGPWFCMRPKDPHLTCNNWKYHFMDTKQSSKNLEDSLSEVEKQLFKRTKKRMTTASITPFNVTSSNKDRPRLLFCGEHNNVPTTIEKSGYFLHNKWQRFDCNLKSFNSSDINVCLTGKTLHLYGDSTARQMYTYLEDKLKCTKSNEKHRCTIRNITIHFKFHGFPIRLNSVHQISYFQYVAEEIDDLQGGPGVFILISVSAHFGRPEGSFYRDRLLAIKAAIDRLWQRSPRTTVIIRSANTREHSMGWFILVSSDWIALQEENILRSVFSNDKRLLFMDVWDMTLVQHPPDHIHPLEPTLEQIMNYMLTLICHE